MQPDEHRFGHYSQWMVRVFLCYVITTHYCSLILLHKTTYSETLLHNFICKTNCLKDLGSFIRLQGWNTHFGHHLGNPSLHSIRVILFTEMKHSMTHTILNMSNYCQKHWILQALLYNTIITVTEWCDDDVTYLYTCHINVSYNR